MTTQRNCHPITITTSAIFSFLLVLAPFVSAFAEDAVVAETSADKHEVALKTLRPDPGPIRLVGIQNSAQVSFPVSSRQRLSDVEIALYVTNSITLNDRSHMAVAVNGVVIGQIPFSSQHPETRARITIPVELIQAGYNQISFNVAQHSLDSCEDHALPELWSEIDTTRSTISYSVKSQAIKPKLSELPLLIDKRLVGQYNLTIATAGKLDNNVIEAGGLVAQTAALSRDYATLGIKHVTVSAPLSGLARQSIAALPADLFNGGDGVLLGDRKALAPWLDNETLAMADEPLLAIFPFGPQREQFVLVVTGADNAQVRQAAQTLVQAYSTLPPNAKANISELTAAAPKQRPTLQPGTRHPFSDFNFRTITRQGILPQGITVRFWVPADHFAYPDSKLNLSLHLAYGAGFGPQSVLNVFLNDHFEHAVSLSDIRGAAYYDYQVPIPISNLVPGWNELQFRPSLIPHRAEGRCQPIYTENLLLTLFEDSYLESADMLQLIELPDLSLFGRTSYPFAGGRDEIPVQLALTGHESGTLEAAWTLLGKLAQVNNAPILNMHTVAPDKAEGTTLVVGQLDKVPPSLLQHSSLNRPGWMQLGNAKADTERFFSSKQARNSKSALNVSLGNLLDHSVLVTQFKSPGWEAHSVVMVVASSAELLSRQVATLVDAPYWGQLRGGTVVLAHDSETVRNYGATKTYMVGNAGLKARISHLFAQSPSLAIMAIASAILLFALLTWRLLVAYRRHQHERRIG